ncbi:unnamed protein product [Heligmosomoides polygyrus]|uniref:Pkinase_Tyr domain-containing protein n=1 Tax=Heligmosomoides polygyrus TaxID=6339 RepID=A0A183GDQ9_HELPZ|nr:unnamed protein product [Heligmosomoides polygyrus]
MINMCDLDWPWWAPECISNRIFDITTDVWAFGCVIFEINHDGLGPYAFQKKRPQSHNDLQAIFEKKEKMVIVQEDDVDTFLDELLFMCQRPTFDYLFSFFRNLLFDFSLDPEAIVQQYIKKPPKKFDHPPRKQTLSFVTMPELASRTCFEASHQKDQSEQRFLASLPSAAGQRF